MGSAVAAGGETESGGESLTAVQSADESASGTQEFRKDAAASSVRSEQQRIDDARSRWHEISRTSPNDSTEVVVSLARPMPLTELQDLTRRASVAINYVYPWIDSGSDAPIWGQIDLSPDVKPSQEITNESLVEYFVEYFDRRIDEVDSELDIAAKPSARGLEKQLASLQAQRDQVQSNGLSVFAFTCECTPANLNTVDADELDFRAVEVVDVEKASLPPIFPVDTVRDGLIGGEAS